VTEDPLRATVGAVWLNHERRGEGEPLVLLHSLGGSLVQWSPVMDLLAAEREVVAIDMPGFGDSPPLPEGIPPRAANLATAVLDFYDALGIEGKPAIAGISLGGWVAIECARQGAASAVVALCPAGFWQRALKAPSQTIARARRRGRAARGLIRPIMSTSRGRRRALGRFIYKPERLSPGEAEAIARAYVTAPAYEEASALMRAGRIEELKGIKVPVTLAWAEHDTLVRNKPLPKKALPRRVEQVELPGCGHVPTWDDPDLVARVILAGARRKR
jgi:pimeloyl-ACP methyl ester carboxylesterase